MTEVVMPSNRASSDAGPESAGRESRAAMESPKALIAPLKRGWGINKSSSDDRPGPGICGRKYVEDAKAARSVRVRGIETGHHQMPGRSWQAGLPLRRWKARRP